MKTTAEKSAAKNLGRQIATAAKQAKKRGMLPALHHPDREEDWGPIETVLAELTNLPAEKLVALYAIGDALTVGDLARYLLAQRGMNSEGAWVGFDTAATLHGIPRH